MYIFAKFVTYLIFLQNRDKINKKIPFTAFLFKRQPMGFFNPNPLIIGLDPDTDAELIWAHSDSELAFRPADPP
jgi:hypothetical protein